MPELLYGINRISVSEEPGRQVYAGFEQNQYREEKKRPRICAASAVFQDFSCKSLSDVLAVLEPLLKVGEVVVDLHLRADRLCLRILLDVLVGLILVKHSCLGVVGKLDVDDAVDAPLEPCVEDRGADLNSVVKVPGHPVSGADEVLR